MTRTRPLAGEDTNRLKNVNIEEHCIQVELLEAAITALGKKNPERHLLLEQLHVFTQVHFTSEQLLMRLKHDPAYDQHVNQHQKLLQDLSGIRSLVERNALDEAASQLAEHSRKVKKHILSWDNQL